MVDGDRQAEFLQAMGEGGRLTVASCLKGGEAEVSVADRGPGIPAALADRVFEPFFTTKQQGVGIGLSISQSIVESHGGVIRVDNGFAGGAIFRVWLPVRDGEAR